MNILVTGKTGKLGRIMLEELPQSSNHYYFTNSSDLNLLDEEAIIGFLSANDIDLIINGAAYTNVQGAENNYPKAFALNVTAVKNIAHAALKNKCFVIHISTDYVFCSNEKRTPFKEDDIASPTNIYGRTKLEGERILITSGCHYIIFRTSWLFSEYSPNFLTSSYNNLFYCRQLSASTSQIGSPTYIRDLAKAIYYVVEKNLFLNNEGVFHLSAIGSMSMYDINCFVARLLGSHCKVLPVSHITKTCPGFTSLNVEKFQNTFKYHLPTSEYEIKTVVEKYKNNLGYTDLFTLYLKKLSFVCGLDIILKFIRFFFKKS